jgi:hypothetical protein
MPLPPPLLTLLGKIIATERSKRDRVVGLKAREVANTFPAGHSGRLVAVDRACEDWDWGDVRDLLTFLS